MIPTDAVLAGIVTWNPDEQLSGLVSVLRASGLEVVVVDNGSTGGTGHLDTAEAAGAHVIRLDGNLGVATGLARAFEHARHGDRRWLLTLDQDSSVGAAFLSTLLGSTAAEASDVAVVAPLVFDAASGRVQQGDPTRPAPYDVDAVITSGSLCRVDAVAAIGVREDLFIDYVDWDLSLRLRSAGWRLVVEPGARLEHSIGAGREHRLPVIGTTVVTSNHSADRLYYRFRNFLLLLRAGTTTPHRRWLARNAAGLALSPVKVALFEHDRRAKLRAMAAGVLDGIRDRGGPRPGTTAPSAVPLGTTTRISVCMATYNGSRFVVAQVRSILDQLGEHDELVIVDDASTDDTVALVRRLGDPRIRIVESSRNAGHVRTFERAMSLSHGRYLMLADQDDLWPAGRVERMLTALRTSTFVAGNHSEAAPGPARLTPGMDHHPWSNVVGLALGRREYFGCAMGMTRPFLEVALPFPAGVEAHDHWLAIAANMSGNAAHLDEVVVDRTVHESNLTPSQRRGLPAVARTRLTMLRLAAVARQRCRSARRRDASSAAARRSGPV